MRIRRRLAALGLAAAGLVAGLLPVGYAVAADTATVFYKPPGGWTTTNIHYSIGGGPWTNVPGAAMDEAPCAGWARKTIDLGSAASLKAAFNNGSGAWDNNGTHDYVIGAGRTTIADGVMTADAADTCEGEPEPDPSPTPTPDPAYAPATILGGDPRKDAIYFAMTARFFDGDPANNRGGSQHTKSGNATNDDPMFRGDFKDLADKLDYIKGLGFSALWITPVVLNRSDYDYHGYHGRDFYRIGPRLESDGVSYQQVIDRAHAMGIKIYQDVVYNHSSRWGAKGLYTPTVYGVRDSDWSWYYDEKVTGKDYNPLEENAQGKSCNGDLWSTTEPAGNTCRDWGKPTGGTSPQGYKLYNCQWPSPTSAMFPATSYHQCWIGNWEGRTPAAAGCTRTWPT